MIENEHDKIAAACRLAITFAKIANRTLEPTADELVRYADDLDDMVCYQSAREREAQGISLEHGGPTFKRPRLVASNVINLAERRA